MWRCYENAVTLSPGDSGRRSAFSPVLRPSQPLARPSEDAQATISETVLVDEEDEEEEEEDIIEITATFPLGQYSRTSPGNHATIRRYVLFL